MIPPPLDFVTYAVIEDNIIRDCGLLDFEYDDGQNGEGVCEYKDYEHSTTVDYYKNIAQSNIRKAVPATTQSEHEAFNGARYLCIQVIDTAPA